MEETETKSVLGWKEDLFFSVQFLTQVPIKSIKLNDLKPDFSQHCRLFPIVGLIAAIPAIITLCIGGFLTLPPTATVVLAIAAYAFTTGALHEDGLADVADGFGGGHTKERKLEIMKDSRIGSYGMLATILAILLKVFLLIHLLEQSLLSVCLAFLAAQCVSRAAQVWFWHSLPPARSDGLSRLFGAPTNHSMQLALFTGITLGIVLSFVHTEIPQIAFGLGFVVLGVLGFRQLCKNQIGGQTGDTIGAVQIISEIAFLIGLTTFAS